VQQFALDVLALIQLKEIQNKHALFANQQHGIMQEFANVNKKFTIILFIFCKNFN
jgi:hypothetical protein